MAAPIVWSKSPTKSGQLLKARVGPFAMNIESKGDGRWAWSIFQNDGRNPTAAGVTPSLGAAKNVIAQYIGRSGLV